MCGRYALFMGASAATALFEQLFGELQVVRYNIAPAQEIPVWTGRGIDFIHWGIARTQYGTAIQETQQINTRVETMLQEPRHYPLRRCVPVIVPACGFFMWKTLGQQKIPYFVQAKTGELLGLGALAWKDPVRKIWSGVTIVTQPTQLGLQTIDVRKPLLFRQNVWETWMHSKAKTWAQSAALTIAETELMAYVVTKHMNDPTFNHRIAIQPLT